MYHEYAPACWVGFQIKAGVSLLRGPQTASEAHRYTGCHGRNGPNFGRVFLMLNYTDITQNTYIQS